MATEHPYTNRLIHQKSPYLLQHAHNPIDWYPWGEEAFAVAKELDKPIFLSIGYATCHWCHVMERESFEDPLLAKQMNSVFICIKVDREELPEVDSLYMEFAQSMMAGAAGWPLNLMLTPSLQPFFAATYLPAHTLHGMMGLSEITKQIAEIWSGDERELLEEQSAKIVELFSEHLHFSGEKLPEKEDLEDAVDFLFKIADPIYGGMKGAPKFPLGYQINFMLRYSAKMKDSRALFIAERTLDMMHRGGIYDHIAGGFSRYSVDEAWFLPHFEKMLYDNSLLAEAYNEAWRATKKASYRQVAEEVLDYVLREMSHPHGGFYSAQDADSEGREGYYYTWLHSEVQSLLGEKESRLFCDFYDVTADGNFEGRNILHTKFSLEEFAAKRALNPKDLEHLFDLQRRVLFDARSERVPPLKDDKILCSWNGLMIAAMAKATHNKNSNRFCDGAVSTALFLKKHLWKEKDKILLRRWREGEAKFEAGFEEYAFLISGLISLFEANRGSDWLKWALELAEVTEQTFKSQDGAYFQTSGKDESIILRKCQYSDGAEPSGNAVHCENLLKLYSITYDERYLSSAEAVLKAVDKYIENYPPGYCYHLMNVNRYYDKNAPTIVVALNEDKLYQEALFELINTSFIPHKVVIWRHVDDSVIGNLLPSVASQVPIDGKTTLYICHHGVCKKPLTLFSDMVEAISEL